MSTVYLYWGYILFFFLPCHDWVSVAPAYSAGTARLAAFGSGNYLQQQHVVPVSGSLVRAQTDPSRGGISRNAAVFPEGSTLGC